MENMVNKLIYPRNDETSHNTKLVSSSLSKVLSEYTDTNVEVAYVVENSTNFTISLRIPNNYDEPTSSLVLIVEESLRYGGYFTEYKVVSVDITKDYMKCVIRAKLPF